jgi:hypothetical protein
MKIIHMGAFKSSEEQMAFVTVIHHNVIDAMAHLLAAAEKLSIEIEDKVSSLFTFLFTKKSLRKKFFVHKTLLPPNWQ